MDKHHGLANLPPITPLELLRQLENTEEHQQKECPGLTADNRLICQSKTQEILGTAYRDGDFNPHKKRLAQVIYTDRSIETVQEVKGYVRGYLYQQHINTCQKEPLTEDLQQLYEYGNENSTGLTSKALKAALMAERLMVEEKRELTPKLDDAYWEKGSIEFTEEEATRFQQHTFEAAQYPEISQIQQLTSAVETNPQNLRAALGVLRQLPPATPSDFTSQAADTILRQCFNDGNKHLLNEFYQIVRAWPEAKKEAFSDHWQKTGFSYRHPLKSLGAEEKNQTVSQQDNTALSDNLTRRPLRPHSPHSSQSSNKKRAHSPTPTQYEASRKAPHMEDSIGSDTSTVNSMEIEEVSSAPESYPSLPTMFEQFAVTSVNENIQQKTTPATEMSIENNSTPRRDPFLDCPECPRQFIYGEIQKLKAHMAAHHPKTAKQQGEAETAKSEPANGYGNRTAIVTSNLLEQDIDVQIQAEVQYRMEETAEVSLTGLETNSITPIDENLFCPMCKKAHGIGQIQRYNKHVKDCNGTK